MATLTTTASGSYLHTGFYGGGWKVNESGTIVSGEAYQGNYAGDDPNSQSAKSRVGVIQFPNVSSLKGSVISKIIITIKYDAAGYGSENKTTIFRKSPYSGWSNSRTPKDYVDKSTGELFSITNNGYNGEWDYELTPTINKSIFNALTNWLTSGNDTIFIYNNAGHSSNYYSTHYLKILSVKLEITYEQGLIWICTDESTNTWKRAIPWICTDESTKTWKRAIPWICTSESTNSWKRCGGS